MKKFAAATALTLVLSSPGFAANSIIMDQTGSFAFAPVQTGDELHISGYQHGNGNESTVIQNGFNQRTQIKQQGDSNLTNSVTYGDNHESYTDVTGNGNRLNIYFGTAGTPAESNYYDVLINGDTHTVNAVSTGFANRGDVNVGGTGNVVFTDVTNNNAASPTGNAYFGTFNGEGNTYSLDSEGANYSDYIVTGNANQTTVSQTQSGPDSSLFTSEHRNIAQGYITGDSNTLTHTQSGLDNVAYSTIGATGNASTGSQLSVGQTGSGNIAYTNILGNTAKSTATQAGNTNIIYNSITDGTGAETSVTQTGNGNTGTFESTGASAKNTSVQTGNTNAMTNILKGDGSTSTVSQTGNSGIVNALNRGNSNTLNATQGGTSNVLLVGIEKAGNTAANGTNLTLQQDDGTTANDMTAYALEDNVVINNRQSGSRNYVRSEAGSQGSSINVQQTGDDQRAEAYAQLGGSGNAIVLNQDRDGNAAAFGNDGRVTIYNGTNNSASLTQKKQARATVTLDSGSSANVVSVAQDNVGGYTDVYLNPNSSNSELTLLQNSDSAIIGVNMAGDRNILVGTQTGGASNTAYTTINGNTNSATYTQTGDGNGFALVAMGNSNTNLLTQTGGANLATVNQTGNSNSFTGNQTGSNNALLVNQIGNGNTANITQSN